MKLLKRYAEKSNVLWKTIKLFYSVSPATAVTRDVIFLIQTALDMYMIRLGGLFLDSIVDIFNEWSSFSYEDFFVTQSFYWFALMLGTWMVNNAIGKARAHLKIRVEEEVTFQMDQEIMHKVSTSNLQDVETPRYRDLLTLVPAYSIDNVLAAYNSFSDVLKFFIKSITSIFILYGTMGWSAFVLILFAVPETVWGHINRKKIRKYRDSEVDKLKFIEYLKAVSTRLPFFPEMRVDGTFSYLKKAYNKGGQEYLEGFVEKDMHFRIDTALFAVTGQLMKYGYIVYILSIAIQRGLSIGEFKALYDYAATAYQSAFHFLNKTFQISTHVEYGRHYFDFLEYQGFGDAKHGDMKLKKSTPALQLQNLDFQYPHNKKKVLENINMKIEPGQKVAIIGGDGSGKSSLIKVLTGLYAINIGDYMIDDYSVRELDRGELKKKISVVFQNFVRYNFKLMRNITLSGEKDRLNKSLYEKVLKISGVDKIMKKEGLTDNQLLGKYFNGGRDLAPGHWQRIAIARMLYRNRDIFVMDEPFTYIDGSSRADILDGVIDFVGEDKILLYITQDTDHLQKFDHIYFLKDGKIAEHGGYKELIKKKGLFYKETRYNK